MNSSSRVFSSNKEKASKIKLELAPQGIPDYQGFAQHEKIVFMKHNKKKGCNAFLNMLKHKN